MGAVGGVLAGMAIGGAVAAADVSAALAHAQVDPAPADGEAVLAAGDLGGQVEDGDLVEVGAGRHGGWPPGLAHGARWTGRDNSLAGSGPPASRGSVRPSPVAG